MTRLHRGCSIFAVLAALAASPAAAQRDTAAAPDAGVVVVTGRVLDARTGQPLHAASVRAQSFATSAYTDQAGRFVVPLPAGAQAVSVGMLGYAAREERWAVAAGDTPRVVRLEPDTVMQRALREADRRIQQRSRTAEIAPRHWERDDLLNDTSANAAEFVFAHARLPWASCLGFAGRRAPREERATPRVASRNGADCVRIGGVTTHPCVLLDEQPSSMYQLGAYLRQELYRVEAYARAGTIVAYSTAFVQRMAQRDMRLPPLDRQAQLICDALR